MLLTLCIALNFIICSDNVPQYDQQSIIAVQPTMDTRLEHGPLIAGRLVPRECVTWSNHELIGDGHKPITSQMNIPRTEIECLYVNGQEVKPTPEQIIAMQTAILEDKRHKASVRKENAAAKKAVKDQLDRLYNQTQTPGIPIVAPAKASDDRTNADAKASDNRTNADVKASDNRSNADAKPGDDCAIAAKQVKRQRAKKMANAVNPIKPQKKKENPCTKTSGRQKRRKKNDDDDDEDDYDEDSDQDIESEQEFEDENEEESEEVPESSNDNSVDEESDGGHISDDQDLLGAEELPNHQGWISER